MNMNHLTKHALVRMSQRGIRVDDLALAELIGTEVAEGCLVRRKDVQAFVREPSSTVGRQANRPRGRHSCHGLSCQ
jgi:hypothetical protein